MSAGTRGWERLLLSQMLPSTELRSMGCGGASCGAPVTAAPAAAAAAALPARAAHGEASLDRKYSRKGMRLHVGLPYGLTVPSAWASAVPPPGLVLLLVALPNRRGRLLSLPLLAA